NERELVPDLIVSSPAERALSTAILLGEKIGYPAKNIHTDGRLYHATEDEILSIVRKFNDSNDEVMVLGHNPGLTDFVNSLSGDLVTDNLPTCGIVAISLDVGSWTEAGWGKGKVGFYDFPRNTSGR
ncbi:MAG TPA: histidine phosphatase family protein, partial [Chryseosolibacter sp.]